MAQQRKPRPQAYQDLRAYQYSNPPAFVFLQRSFHFRIILVYFWGTTLYHFKFLHFIIQVLFIFSIFFISLKLIEEKIVKHNLLHK